MSLTAALLIRPSLRSSLFKITPLATARSNYSNDPVESPECQPSGYIPLNQLQVKYMRSSGPGGQNVNKVNSKVEVRFHVGSANWIEEDVKGKFQELHSYRITKDGYFMVKSDKTRMQTLNLADCLDKIRCYLQEAAKPPPENLPETIIGFKERKDEVAARRLTEKKLKGLHKRLKDTTYDFQ